MDASDSCFEAKQKSSEATKEGIQAFERGEFQKCIDILTPLAVKEMEKDQVLNVYITTSRDYLQSGAPSSWDRVSPLTLNFMDKF